MQQKASRGLKADFRFEINVCIFIPTIGPVKQSCFPYRALTYEALSTSWSGAVFDALYRVHGPLSAYLVKVWFCLLHLTVKRYHKIPVVSRIYQLLVNEKYSTLEILNTDSSFCFTWIGCYLSIYNTVSLKPLKKKPSKKEKDTVKILCSFKGEIFEMFDFFSRCLLDLCELRNYTY